MKIRIKGGNAFGYLVVQSAYEGGREWLQELLKIIEGNYLYMKTEIERELPEAKVSELEGTYLLWIDIGAYVPGKEIKQFIVDKCGLGVDFGYWFGGADYAGFIRVNLATKFENIETLTQRLIDNIQSL
jgi:cystathionine beta-lyase